MDRRTTFANTRVADAALQGHVTAERYVTPTKGTVREPVVDLCATPGGARDTQLLYGQSVDILEEADGFAFVRGHIDGYVGYVAASALGDVTSPTHRVAVPASHLYPRPDIKAHEAAWLSFNSELRVVSASGAFFETDTGHFIPKPHLRPLNAPFTDMAAIAQLFFGVPYLWGGSSAAGLDCSALVQAAILATGHACPRDSDQQAAALGARLPDGTQPVRGDLFFWKGHVAIAVDHEVMIHANAHHMAVAYEPIAQAIERIKAQGEGPVTAHKRL